MEKTRKKIKLDNFEYSISDDKIDAIFLTQLNH